MHNILYLHETAYLSGAENSLLGLASNLDKKIFNLMFACPSVGLFAERIRSFGIKLYPVEYPRVRNIIGVWKTVQNIRGIIRENNIDIVHSNSIRTHVYAVLAGRMEHIPVVWHERNMLDLDKEIMDPDRILAFLPDVIICNSCAVAGRFMKNGKVMNKARVVLNGVNAMIFNPAVNGDLLRREFNISKEETVVGMASRFHKSKGHEVFFSAAAQLMRNSQNVRQRLRFLVVGGSVFGEDKWREDYLKDLAIKLKIDDRVIFTGSLENMPDAYAAMDIFVIAAMAEACGRVIIEAMAMGKPVIGTHSGGTPEMIEDGVSGFLFEPGDFSALADKITFLADNPDIAKKMGMAGRIRIEENFSINRNVKQVQDIYLELLHDE